MTHLISRLGHHLSNIPHLLVRICLRTAPKPMSRNLVSIIDFTFHTKSNYVITCRASSGRLAFSNIWVFLGKGYNLLLDMTRAASIIFLDVPPRIARERVTRVFAATRTQRIVPLHPISRLTHLGASVRTQLMQHSTISSS